VEIPAAFSESMTETAYGECKNLAAFALSNKFSRKMLPGNPNVSRGAGHSGPVDLLRPPILSRPRSWWCE
jgi:hypothetical protein